MFFSTLKNFVILSLSFLLISCNDSRYGISKSIETEYVPPAHVRLDRNNPDLLARDIQSGSNYNHEISRADVEKYFSNADLSTLEITKAPDWLRYEFDRSKNRAFFRGTIPHFEELPDDILIKGTIKDLEGLEHNWEFSLSIKKDTVPLLYTRDILVSLGAELQFKITTDMISDLTQFELDNREYKIIISDKPDWLQKIDEETFTGTVPHVAFSGSEISGSIHDSSGNKSNWSFNLIAPSTSLAIMDRLAEVGNTFSYQIPLDISPNTELFVTNLPCWMAYNLDIANKTLTFSGTPTEDDLGDNIVAGTIVNEYNVPFGWTFEIYVTKDLPPVITSLKLEGSSPSQNQNPVLLASLKGANENTVVKIHPGPTCETNIGELLLDGEKEQVSIEVTDKLSEGTHLLYASITDLSTEINCHKNPLAYTVDTKAPVVSGLVIETLRQKNNDKNPTLTVYFNDADIGSIVKIFNEKQCTAPIAQKTLNNLTDKIDVKLNDLRDGEHVFYASVVDFAGNESSCKKIPGPYRLDTKPPVISKVSFIGENPSKDRTPTFNVTLLDNLASHIKLFNDRACRNEIGISSIGKTTVADVTADEELEDGEHTLYVRAFDSAGNAGACTLADDKPYIVDNFEKACNIIGLHDSTTPTRVKTFILRGCDEYRYIVTDKATLENSSTAWSEWGAYSSVQTPTQRSIENTYYLHLQGRNVDKLGNVSRVTTKISSAYIDSKRPKVIGLENMANTQAWNFGCDEQRCLYRFQITRQETSPVMTQKYSNITSVSRNCVEENSYLHVQAKDMAGNESEVVTKKIGASKNDQPSEC